MNDRSKKPTSAREGAAEKRSSFSISHHQITAAADPKSGIATLGKAGGDGDAEPFLGRPYAIWRRRPDIAFEINERLSKWAAG